jgi:hypothetical protein
VDEDRKRQKEEEESVHETEREIMKRRKHPWDRKRNKVEEGSVH